MYSRLTMAEQRRQRVIQPVASPIRKAGKRRGSSSSDEAKIGGITPAVFSFSGRCELSPCEHPVADLALGILDQQPALRALDEHDERDHDNGQG
jgi:hypothetical protein